MATYRQLLAEKARIESELAKAREQEAEKVLESIRTHVNEFGFTAADIFGGKLARGAKRGNGVPKGGRSPVAAKYRDPKSGATWSGRGRAPGWIAGKNREKFAIAE